MWYRANRVWVLLPPKTVAIWVMTTPLPGRGRLAQQVVVEVNQQMFQGAGRRLHGLGVVFLLQQGLGFGQGLRVVHFMFLPVV